MRSYLCETPIEADAVGLYSEGYITERAPGVLGVRGAMMSERPPLDYWPDGYESASYEAIGEWLAAHPGPVTLDFDSPGGETGGLLKLARQIADRGDVTAHVTGAACSAAYVLAAACATIEAEPDGILGSIGTCMVVPATPDGYRTSSLAPRKNAPDEQVQALLDDIESQILSFVSSRRFGGVLTASETAARTMSGAVMPASTALEIGMIDKIKEASAPGSDAVEQLAKQPAEQPVTGESAAPSVVTDDAIAELRESVGTLAARLDELAKAIESRLDSLTAAAAPLRIEGRCTSGAAVTEPAKSSARPMIEDVREYARIHGVSFTAALRSSLANYKQE